MNGPRFYGETASYALVNLALRDQAWLTASDSSGKAESAT